MSTSKTDKALEVSKIVRDDLSDEQKALLERIVRDRISELAKTSQTLSQTASGALNSKTDVVYDTVHVLYDLSSLPFSREGFVAYLTDSHNVSKGEAEIIAISANIPSGGDADFAKKIEESRTFPQPFVIQEVVLASTELTTDPYRPETVRRVIEGIDTLDLIGRGNYGSNTAFGFPKHTTILVKPELRKIFEEAVFEAQKSVPPTPPKSGRLEKLTAALAFSVAMIIGNVAEADQGMALIDTSDVSLSCDGWSPHKLGEHNADSLVYFSGANAVSGMHQKLLDDASGATRLNVQFLADAEQLSSSVNVSYEMPRCDLESSFKEQLAGVNATLKYVQFAGASTVSGMHRKLLDDASDSQGNTDQGGGEIRDLDQWLTVASADSVNSMHQGLWSDAASKTVLE